MNVWLWTQLVCEINHTIVQMFEHMFESPKHICIELFPTVEQCSFHFKPICIIFEKKMQFTYISLLYI